MKATVFPGVASAFQREEFSRLFIRLDSKAASFVAARQQASFDLHTNPNSRKHNLDSQLIDFTVFADCKTKVSLAGGMLVASQLSGKALHMKSSHDLHHDSLKSIDQSLIKTVMQTYANCKAAGHGEMAARNAAIVVLREALPTWNFRAASDMVSRIIALSGSSGQTAQATG